VNINDELAPTVQSRLDIGFPSDRNNWATAAPAYYGDTLHILGHQVMQRWETPYMQTLASIAASGRGHVLEVGYGMGIATKFVQAFKPRSHTIIEANRGVYANMLADIARYRYTARGLLGFWAEFLGEFPCNSLDGILFDTYPLKPEEIHKNHLSFIPHAYRVLKKGGVLTYYSDEKESLSKEDQSFLRQCGFRTVNGVRVQVAPPADCCYWKDFSIVAPVIRK